MHRQVNQRKRQLEAACDHVFLLIRKGDHSQAERLCKQIDLHEPDFPDVLFARGLIASQKGDLVSAKNMFMRACSASPKRSEFHVNLAGVEMALGEPASALASYCRAHKISPELSIALTGMVDALLAVGEMRRAEECLIEAVRREPGCSTYRHRLGELYLNAGFVAQTITTYDQLLAHWPDDIRAQHCKAICLMQMGRVDEGRDALDSVLKKEPQRIAALTLKLDSGDYQGRDVDVSVLRSLYAQSVDLGSRADTAFALANEAINSGCISEAVALLNEANGLRRELDPYDPELEVRLVAKSLATFTVESFRKPLASEHLHDSPIFIIGLPRSGSTLLEQMLSNHSMLATTGENETWPQSLVGREKLVSIPALIEAFDLVDDDYLAKCGRDYMRRQREEFGIEKRVVDKTLSNYLYLGAIARAIPKAKFVHIRRHPMANAFSIYQQNFKDNSMSNNLRDIGDFMRRYRESMEHWKSVLPNGYLIDVEYECLVEEPEEQMRRILSFCELPWEEQCLHPERSSKAVATASVFQVRKAIHANTKERWRPYAELLEPVRQILNETELD